MKFGICCDPKESEKVLNAGFDFIEINVQSHLHDDNFGTISRVNQEQILENRSPIAVANCFIPAAMPLVGPRVQLDQVEQYISEVMNRAFLVGIDTIVFGSGGARNIPEGIDRDEAMEQLVAFGVLAASKAAQHGITIVVEPLNRSECNVLNTVHECAQFVHKVGHQNMMLMVDGYHWAKDNDSFDDIIKAGPLLRHAHIATYRNRKAPSLESCDFSRFFQALDKAKYDGRLSIEASWNALDKEALAALIELKRVVEASRW